MRSVKGVGRKGRLRAFPEKGEGMDTWDEKDKGRGVEEERL